MADSREPLLYKEIGVTKGKLNPLEKLGLIKFVKKKTRSMPKNPNAATITPLGLALLSAMRKTEFSILPLINGLEERISKIQIATEEIMRMQKSLVKKLNEGTETLGAFVTDMTSELEMLNDSLSEIKMSLVNKEITSSQVIEIIRKHSGKLTGIASVSDVFESLRGDFGISSQKAEKILLKMFEEGKIQLEAGQGKAVVRSPDGERYAFIRLP